MIWIYHSLFTFSLIEGHFGCFQFLTIENNTASMNIRVHICVCVCVNESTFLFALYFFN